MITEKNLKPLDTSKYNDSLAATENSVVPITLFGAAIKPVSLAHLSESPFGVGFQIPSLSKLDTSSGAVV